VKSPRPYYHEFAWAYDLLQTENVQARVDFIETVLAQNGIAAGSRVLDAGCGSGRYAAEFAKRGFNAFGVDRSPELIAVARGRDSGAQFAVADLLTFSPRKMFDAVLCRGVLNDFVTDAARRSIFRQFATWLRAGGIVVLDAREWTRTVARFAENPLHRRTIDLPHGRLTFESETRLDHESGRMLIHERFEMDKGDETSLTENEFVMRPWSAEEISDYLDVNQFRLLGTGTSYGESDAVWSDRIIVSARKSAGNHKRTAGV